MTTLPLFFAIIIVMAVACTGTTQPSINSNTWARGMTSSSSSSSSSQNTTTGIIISEISDKGSSTACDGSGSDWVELYNTGVVAADDGTTFSDDQAIIDLSGYVLYDDRGVDHADVFTFAPGQQLGPGEYLVLCHGGVDASTSLQFKIGGDDTITLVNAANEIVASVGPLPDGKERDFDVTYAWNGNTYMYTSTPTPGTANVLTPIVLETSEQLKQRLARQNEQGRRFFGMDDNGFPVEDGYGEVLDLHLTMEQADYDYLMQNASFQLYSPFTSARVVRSNGNGVEEELLMLNSPGRLRAKGQVTLYIANCVGTEAMPYSIEFDTINKTQTLFGAERIYMRTHQLDRSSMRDWAAHRMLARFGLPHLRARTMRFFINGEKIGFYTVLEAAEQEYVFHRSFPNYNPESFALYKVKTLSKWCGEYTRSELQAAQARIDDTSTPPYSFERGDHREPTRVRGPSGHSQCMDDFIYNLFEVEWGDVTLAYLRHNEDCGKMMVEEGIVDLDLGTKDFDSQMEDFINENLADNKCNEGCQNSNLAQQVDIENFLKTFAFLAVTIILDSPMGNGNNYYLAEAGDGTGWKMVSYDHNSASGRHCSSECDDRLPYWSIIRPTCESLEENQLVGPLLTNATLHAQYVEYVRTFTNEVLGNVSFVEEMTRHVQAIEEYVKEDYWGRDGIYMAAELSPDAAEWYESDVPLLPFYKKRVEEVQKQLEALDEGTFARGPHLGGRDVDPDEVCVDWRSPSYWWYGY